MSEQKPRDAKQGEKPSASHINSIIAFAARQGEVQALSEPLQRLVENEVICAIYLKNDSGVDAPMHAPVTLTGRTGADVDILQFDKPSGPPYAIMLEPATAEKLGLAVIGSGAFPVLVKSGETVQVGDRLEPTINQWYVEVVAGGALVALSDVSENKCWAMFAGGGAAIVTSTMAFSLPLTFIKANGIFLASRFRVPSDKAAYVTSCVIADRDGNDPMTGSGMSFGIPFGGVYFSWSSRLPYEGSALIGPPNADIGIWIGQTGVVTPASAYFLTAFASISFLEV